MVNKQSISSICRELEFSAQNVFALLIEQQLLYKERINDKPFNLLTDKGKFFGGEHCRSDDGGIWSIWEKDFIEKFVNGVDLLDKFLMSVDHMTHISNLDSILEYGLLSHGNRHQKRDISNQAVNGRRSGTEPINGNPIHSYVPFYYNPRNAMLYHNKDIQEEIIILGFNPSIMLHKDAIYSYGNAARSDTDFYQNLEEYIDDFDKCRVFSDSWYGDEQLRSTMMSELLIPNQVDLSLLEYIFCYTSRAKDYLLENYDLSGMKICVNRDLYFN